MSRAPDQEVCLSDVALASYLTPGVRQFYERCLELGPMSQSRLAVRLGMSRGTVARHVRTLTQAKLVSERSPRLVLVVDENGASARNAWQPRASAHPQQILTQLAQLAETTEPGEARDYYNAAMALVLQGLGASKPLVQRRAELRALELPKRDGRDEGATVTDNKEKKTFSKSACLEAEKESVCSKSGTGATLRDASAEVRERWPFWLSLIESACEERGIARHLRCPDANPTFWKYFLDYSLEQQENAIGQLVDDILNPAKAITTPWGLLTKAAEYGDFKYFPSVTEKRAQESGGYRHRFVMPMRPDEVGPTAPGRGPVAFLVQAGTTMASSGAGTKTDAIEAELEDRIGGSEEGIGQARLLLVRGPAPRIGGPPKADGPSPERRLAAALARNNLSPEQLRYAGTRAYELLKQGVISDLNEFLIERALANDPQFFPPEAVAKLYQGSESQSP